MENEPMEREPSILDTLDKHHKAMSLIYSENPPKSHASIETVIENKEGRFLIRTLIEKLKAHS